MAGAAAVILKQAASVTEPTKPGEYGDRPQGVFHASATVEASTLQDLVEMLPDLIKLAAGIPLQFRLTVTLGDGQDAARTAVPGLDPGDRERIRPSAAGGPLARRVFARACSGTGGTTIRSPRTLRSGGTAPFLDWFKMSAREDGIYAYYRMLAEERRRK
jgi:hypothetical protein